MTVIERIKALAARGLSAPCSAKNLSFTGNGKVSVPVASILNSPKVQRHVAAVRRFAALAALEEDKT